MKRWYQFQIPNSKFHIPNSFAGRIMLPFFYITDYDPSMQQVVLDEENSRHIVQVLRMKPGAALQLTDGRGNLLTGDITEAGKRQCIIRIKGREQKPPSDRRVSVSISLLKNPSRFEWFLEKATEIGAAEIIPLLCSRTEKDKFRYDRMLGICISAMLQSQQVWLPSLHKPVSFEEWVINPPPSSDLWIAHCIPGEKTELGHTDHRTGNTVICIGPEGDFTKEEIALAIHNGFIPVALGDTRLRTETAGVVATTLLVQGKK